MSKPWVVVKRTVGEAESVEVSRHRRSREAYRTAHEARLELAPEDRIEILAWVLGGWQIRDSLPRLHANSQSDGTDGPPGVEYVWDHAGRPVAGIDPSAGGWGIWLNRGDGLWERPPKVKDAIHATRTEALARARELAQSPRELTEDLDWQLRWDDARRRTRAARRATLTADMQPLGPTDLVCAYPGCTQPVEWRLSLTGDDVNDEPPRMCCQEHTTLLTFPGGPL